jgi:4'-phosphopantetheinyl transferase
VTSADRPRIRGREATCWIPASRCEGVIGDEVHVWRFSLDPQLADLDRLNRALNDSERNRASRFRTGELRRRFVAGRGTLRAILGFCLKIDPAEVAFTFGEHGKPSLAAGGGAIEFNLAHSGGMALCAVARGRILGVDLEALRQLDDAENIIRRFFSPRERTDFLALPDHERLAAFFRGWTRKEAFLKAKGTGLATDLDSFDVTLRPDEAAALLRVGDDPAEAAHWALFDLDAGPGFAAALAVARGETACSIRLWEGAPDARGAHS